MKKIHLLLILVIGFFIQLKAQSFNSIQEFEEKLNQLSNIEDVVERETQINTLWASLKSQNKIPFTLGDTVVFLYKGSVSNISWAGDMNGWNPNSGDFQGKKVGLSDIWTLKKSYPLDARIDYKIVLNGNNWILDPDNDYQQLSGFGWNSELRMPDWLPSPFIQLMDGVVKGNLSENIRISSSKLGYDVQYKVYTPYNYDSQEKLPVVFVTDGHEYAHDDMGSMIVILDNLIHAGLIKPIMAVFIDPRDPDNLNDNRRANEYTSNDLYVSFVADELVPSVETNYKTHKYANGRAILGTSYGGNNAGYFAATRSDVFGIIMAHSPAFFDVTIEKINQQDKLPIKLFLTTGLIYDTFSPTLKMREVLDVKGYEYGYIEVNEGHSWGNWRALLDDMLIHFFSETLSVEPTIKELNLWTLYPNPLVDNQIYISCKENKCANLELYNTSGQKICSFGTLKFESENTLALNAEVESGTYFLKITDESKKVSVLSLIK